MKHLALLSVLALVGCARPEPAFRPGPEEPIRQPINATCPRSGKPVAADSLTEYRGYVVGFCNTHCRDDFAAHLGERPADTSFFDAAIAALERR